MFYSIRHVTRFLYDAPISESTMEVRMQPRNEAEQRCLHFELSTNPPSRIYSYRDYRGNVVHHFNVPARHTQLRVTAEATVEVLALATLPAVVERIGWAELDAAVLDGEHWEDLKPSRFVASSSLLEDFVQQLQLDRTRDPLKLVLHANTEIYNAFAYTPQSTKVDSPIDVALESKEGVCQDFAHVMLAVLRPFGIPARYVSGYLYHGEECQDRSAAGATHAWIEAWLPELGWIGFDPTNNLVTGDRHIRVATGRDYADVPPTRGVFKGKAGSELSVAVHVSPSNVPAGDSDMLPTISWISPGVDEDEQEQHQQQQ